MPASKTQEHQYASGAVWLTAAEYREWWRMRDQRPQGGTRSDGDRAHDLEAWLGDSADQLDNDQKTELVRISDDIDTRYDGDDPARAAAFTAAAQYMLGDTNTDTAAREYRAAQQARDEALAAAIQVASMSGLSERAAADTIGINRLTIRRHLGKE